MDVQKRNIFSWLVYDFGNSFFVAALGGLFLAQWLILDNGVDDIWYGAGFVLATILVLFTSPLLGSWSDRVGKRMPFLKWATICLFITNGLLAFVAVSDMAISYKLYVVMALVVFVQYFYQISLVFYNALLKDVSDERNRGKISGLGEGFGCFGWLVATVIFLPFASGAITIIGDPGRQQVFLPAFIISTLLELPLLFWFRESNKTAGSLVNQITTKTKETLWVGVKELFKKNKNVGIFLVGFSLISDIVLTFNLYFAVVIDALYGVSDNTKSFAFIIHMLSTIVAGYILGKMGDRFGHKLMIIIACVNLVIVGLLFYLSSSIWILYFVAIFGGAGIGGYFVTSKALMINISPPERLGECFGFYSTFQRFSSVLAPTIWGIVVLILKESGALKYRVAGMIMIILLIVGIFIFTKVKETKEHSAQITG